MADLLVNYETVQNTTPLGAIEEAVKESIWIQTKTKLEMPGFFYEDGKLPTTLREAVKVGTSGMCAIGSENVIHKLATEKGNLFDKMTLISTNILSPDSPLNYDLPQEDRFTYHTYFLVQDKNGVWYAGSPANHYQTKEKDYATTLIVDKDLDALLRKMESRDKSSYPTSSDLMNQMDNMVATPLNSDNQVSIFDIRRTKDGIYTSTYKFSPTKF